MSSLLDPAPESSPALVSVYLIRPLVASAVRVTRLMESMQSEQPRDHHVFFCPTRSAMAVHLLQVDSPPFSRSADAARTSASKGESRSASTSCPRSGSRPWRATSSRWTSRSAWRHSVPTTRTCSPRPPAARPLCRPSCDTARATTRDTDSAPSPAGEGRPARWGESLFIQPLPDMLQSVDLFLRDFLGASDRATDPHLLRAAPPEHNFHRILFIDR